MSISIGSSASSVVCKGSRPSLRPVQVCNLTVNSTSRKNRVVARAATLAVDKMVPLHDRVLVKPLPQEKKTASGLILQSKQQAHSDAHIGEVISVGESVELGLKKGDFIVFQKYASAEVETNDSPIIFVAEKSIFGKLE